MLFCKFLILDKMGESELRVVVWHCRIYIEHLHLIKKEDFFFSGTIFRSFMWNKSFRCPFKESRDC